MNESEFNAANSTMNLLYTHIGEHVAISDENRRIAAAVACVDLGLAANVLLLDGNPDVGKTTLAKVLAIGIGGDYGRVQGDIDTLPSDFYGHESWNPGSRAFDYLAGPMHSNVLLADEANRNSARTQGGLLQGIEEGEVTVGRETHKLPEKRLVVLTQNHNEIGEGTFRMIKALRARVVASVNMPDLTAAQVVSALKMSTPEKPVVSIEELIETGNTINKVTMNDGLQLSVAGLVKDVNNSKDVDSNASILGGARPTKFISALAKSLVVFRGDKAGEGKYEVTPEDIRKVAGFVLRERVQLQDLVLDKEDTSVEQVIDSIVQNYPLRAA